MLRLWLAMSVGLAFVVVSGVIASMARAQPGVDPTAVISGYEAARSRQDMDTAVSYFADDATLTQRNTTLSGKDQIRKYLDSISARAPYIVVSDRHTSGNIVSWTERTGAQQPTPPTTRLPGYTGGQTGQSTTFTGRTGTGPGTNPPVVTQNNFLVTVEAIVQDGKIQSMSYVFGTQVTRPDPALEGRAQLPAGIGLAAVLAVLVGVVLIASTGVGRTTRVNSSLRGHLMQDLQGWAAARD
jgi:SnoaL-like domain